MATVDVLLAGHVLSTDAGKAVHPTVSLVRDGDLVMVVDPGIPSDPAMLTGVRVVDVDSVYDGALWLSHSGGAHAVTDDVRVSETPGHAAECAALVVTTEDGVVAPPRAWWFADIRPHERHTP